MASRRDRGLYDPRNEHDACGIGFVANIKGRKSHDIISRGLQILVNLDQVNGNWREIASLRSQ